MPGNRPVRFGGRAGERTGGNADTRAPAQPTTELRHRWLVAERDSTGSGWWMHEGDRATLHDARGYVEARSPN